jgi:hypothetical protein
MIVDLDPLPCMTAINLIRMCAEYNIDKPKCIEILEAMTVVPLPDIKWELDIPDKYITFFILKQK